MGRDAERSSVTGKEKRVTAKRHPVVRGVWTAAVILACACGARPSLDETFSAAQAELRRGRLGPAETLVAEGLDRTGAAPDTAWAWRFRLLRAELLISRSLLDEASTLLDTPVPAGSDLDAPRARQRLLLARVQVARGRLEPAVALLDEARALAPGDKALAFDVEILASQIRFRTGRFAEAEAGLRSVIADAAASGDTYRQALALNNLGMGFVVRSRFDEALSHFERVLALEDVDGTSVYGQSLNNAGLCLARLGQFDRAEALQRRAIEIHRHGRTQDYLQVVGELGSTYMLQSDFARAVPQLHEAFDIASKAGLNSDAALWARNLAAAHVYLARWDDASRYNDEARRLSPANRPASDLFARVTDAQIAAGRGLVEDARRGFTDVLERSSEEPAARFIAYDGLSKLALQAGRHDETERHFEAALAAIERTRADLLRTDYKLSFLARRINFYQAYVDLLIAQGRDARALEVADSSRGRVLAEAQGVAAPPQARAGVLRSLARDAGTALLFYWLAPARSRVWVVTGDAIQSVVLPPAAEIEALVAQHQSAIQNALSDPLAEDVTAGDRLYEMLVRPVASRIPQGASVTIVPDGALARLSFETLTIRAAPPGAAGGKRYWMEDATIQMAPSLAPLKRRVASGPTAVPRAVPTSSAGAPAASTLASGPGSGSTRASTAGAAAQSSGRPESVLLVGNPTPRPPEFPALSYAAAEMAGITKHFADASVTRLDGERATPAAFRESDPRRFEVIHFTAHAVANVEAPLDSAVILSGPDQAFKLYARDVVAMPLTADLVTVSACRSAGERAYSGEGLVGFAWAFLRAGSERVIAGLWDVDDRSTAALMEAFYAGLAKGAPPAAALREAKLKLIKQGFPKPYYWAAFQLFTVEP
jgi:CHAT domain-containing protein/Tfp pilus assembly protein PilF